MSIVVYAGASGELLPPTPGNQKKKILSALSKLEAGGSTNGGVGIQLAYRRAKENFVKGGINRVILATDGDFNVGVTQVDDLVTMVEKKRDTGIYLSVLGVEGMAESDHRMEQMADHGNGNYAYLDTKEEAKRVLLHEVNETLNAVADNVKIQVEFNPQRVRAHRIIGYDNRQLAKRDFKDDKKDAGDMGDGQMVTALYELELQPDHNKHAKAPFAKLSTRYRPFGKMAHVMFSVEINTLKKNRSTPPVMIFDSPRACRSLGECSSNATRRPMSSRRSTASPSTAEAAIETASALSS